MPLSSTMVEHFAKNAKTYSKQGYKGRTLTLDFFKLALDKTLLPTPITSSSIVHDNASGPGIVTKELIARAKAANTAPPQIITTDISAPMIDIVKDGIAAEGWSDVVRAAVMDGKDMHGIDSASLTHSITNFGIFDCGAQEIWRTLRDGGVALVTTWKAQPWVQLAEEVRQELHPGLSAFPPGPKEWWTREWLEGVMRDAGFRDVSVSVLALEEDVDSVEDMVEQMKGGFWDMARGGLTEEEKSRWDGVLKEQLEKRGSLHFVFEVWCAVAKKA